MPDGIYSIQNIVDFMNNWQEEYNVMLQKMDNRKIAIHISSVVEYWFLQQQDTSYGVGNVPVSYNGGKLSYLQIGEENDKVKCAMKVSLMLSEKLCFMFGDFEQLEDHHSSTGKNLNNTDIKNITLNSIYMADSTDGVNKMFVYWDKVEKSMVGDSKIAYLRTTRDQKKIK